MRFHASKTKDSPEQLYSCYSRFCSKKCSNSNKKVRQKQQNRCIELYGDKCNFTKYKKTCLAKYGTDNIWKTEQFKEKVKKIWIEHYGTDNYFKSSLHNSRMKDNVTEIVEKRNVTKRKNHTFNTSKTEQESYNILRETFPDIISQYKSDVYPFVCDFYIPSIDTYIECNYHWTHGRHPYNPNDSQDIAKVELWKSKDTKYYTNAINTWTIRDVKKLETTRQNNLKFYPVYSIYELKEIIYQLKQEKINMTQATLKPYKECTYKERVAIIKQLIDDNYAHDEGSPVTVLIPNNCPEYHKWLEDMTEHIQKEFTMFVYNAVGGFYSGECPQIDRMDSEAIYVKVYDGFGADKFTLSFEANRSDMGNDFEYQWLDDEYIKTERIRVIKEAYKDLDSDYRSLISQLQLKVNRMDHIREFLASKNIKF